MGVETENTRDERLRGTLRDVRDDIAMFQVAVEIDEDEEPLRARIYERLNRLPAHDLIRAIVLELSDNGEASAQARRIITDLRSVTDGHDPDCEDRPW